MTGLNQRRPPKSAPAASVLRGMRCGENRYTWARLMEFHYPGALFGHWDPSHITGKGTGARANHQAQHVLPSDSDVTKIGGWFRWMKI